VYIGFWWGNLKERDHCGDASVHGRIILIWILRKWGGGGGRDYYESVYGQMAGNESSRFIKCGEFPD